MMTTDLARSGSLKVIERERLADVVSEIGLQQTSMIDASTAQKVGRLLGASHLAFGSLVALDPDLRLDVRLVGVGTGEVLVAERVIGARDKFFELETALADKLLAGLPGAAPAKPTKQTDDLDDVAAYGRALEAEDAGDLEEASKQLSGLVRDEPTFTMAADRYEAVMKALVEARKTRETLMDSGMAEFLAAADAQIAKGNPKASGRGAEELFGTLIARQAAQLDVLVKLGDGGAIDVNIAPARHADYLREVRAWLVSAQALIDALKERRAAGQKPPTFPKLPDDLYKKADRLGLSTPAHWAFLSEYSVASEAALFLALGDVPNRIEDLVPPPMAIDKGLQARALTLIDDALVQCEAHEGRYKEREMVRLHKDKAEILAAMGHKARAIAELQGALERYPMSDEYDSVEEQLQGLLE
jgi:TolB-like protein